MEVDEPQVRLKTSDGYRFVLTKSEISCFNALHMLIEGFQNASPSDCINLQSVDSKTLEKVIFWCNEHCKSTCQTSEGARDNSNIYKRQLTEKDKNYLNSMPDEELFEFIHVASYLNVRCLFNALCQTVGKRWEGMKVEDIRRMYNIECDYTPEEENQMLQESKKLGFSD